MPGASVGRCGGNNKRLSGVAMFSGSSFKAVLIADFGPFLIRPVRLNFMLNH
jgi:hypothetical protein